MYVNYHQPQLHKFCFSVYLRFATYLCILSLFEDSLHYRMALQTSPGRTEHIFQRLLYLADWWHPLVLPSLLTGRCPPYLKWQKHLYQFGPLCLDRLKAEFSIWNLSTFLLVSPLGVICVPDLSMSLSVQQRVKVSFSSLRLNLYQKNSGFNSW